MMSAAITNPAPTHAERSRVLLISGAGDDAATTRMIALSSALLEESGIEVDILDPAQHQSTHVYEKWLFAHAVIVIAPAGSTMIAERFRPAIDRLAEAGYPGQLAERAYGVVVHGDSDSAEQTRRALAGWFEGMGMVDSDSFATLDRYLGYHEQSAEQDAPMSEADYEQEVRNVASAVANAITELRAGRLSPPERRAALKRVC